MKSIDEIKEKLGKKIKVIAKANKEHGSLVGFAYRAFPEPIILVILSKSIIEIDMRGRMQSHSSIHKLD